MIDYLKKFERIVTATLIAMLAVVIFTVALLATGGEIIIGEPDKYGGLTLIGNSAIILTLVAGYFVVSRRDFGFQCHWVKLKKLEVGDG